jgi:hypothetical protein
MIVSSFSFWGLCMDLSIGGMAEGIVAQYHQLELVRRQLNEWKNNSVTYLAGACDVRL